MKWKRPKMFLRAGPLILLLLVATIVDASAFLGFGNSASWKEEVLLHDGRKIIVERSQTHGGRGEVGQSPIKEHSITFALPGSQEEITWKSEYSQDVGRTNFNLLALHVLNETPYVVATPNLCLSYNKWGRPNPPYVIFKYDGKEWQRIPLSELPLEFKEVNLVIEPGRSDEENLVNHGLASAEMIKKLNSAYSKYPNIKPEFMSIIREPLEKARDGCKEMIHTENHKWLSIDWFSDEPNYDACLQVCEREKVAPNQCPCNRFFKNNNKEK
jgi:hypothetical protein